MKFKLDENLGDAGRDLLEADGHDVMTVAEQMLSGVADERVYAVCKDEGRVRCSSSRGTGLLGKERPLIGLDRAFPSRHCRDWR